MMILFFHCKILNKQITPVLSIYLKTYDMLNFYTVYYNYVIGHTPTLYRCMLSSILFFIIIKLNQPEFLKSLSFL